MLASVPVMPIEDAPETAFAIYTALMALVTAGFLAWWFTSEREHGPALPLLILGGALAGLMEPWLDNIVLYRWPPDQNLGAFEAFGRTVPWFVIIGYAWFCGALLYVVAKFLQRGVTARKLWGLYGAIVVVDFLAIGLSAWIGVSDFFGDPPMEILDYPLWWAAIDGLDVILGGALVLLLLPNLKGAQRLWLILVPPVALGAATGIVSWPVSIAINSQWSELGKWLCACATIGLSLAVVYALTKVLPGLARYAGATTSEEPGPGVGVLEGGHGLEGLGAPDAAELAEPVEH